MKKTNKLKDIRRSIRTHLNWLVSTIVGPDFLSDEEKSDIKKSKLPSDFMDGIYYSFFLGKYKASHRPREYKSLTWNEFLQYTRDRKLSKQDLNVIRHARDSAGVRIKTLTDDISNNLFKDLQDAIGDTISEASLRSIIQDETAFAILENKNISQFISALDTRLRTKGKKDWKKIARTELHTSKQKGIVATISNKEDIYASSQGDLSQVSVVPQPGCCVDCTDLYLDSNGNPKIFILRDLIANGINTSHKKVQGKHIHWIAVIPPSHPSCYCELQYIPPGYSWVNRVLTLVDNQALTKAFEGNNQKTVPTPPSIAGVASPGQKGDLKGMSSGVEYEYWPVGRGKPPKEGGWESYKKKDGTAGWRRPAGSGAGKGPKEEEKDPQQVQADAKAWGATALNQDLVISHLQDGDIVHQEQLGAEEKGATESYRITIEGNGRGIMKPPAWSNDIYASAGILASEGSGSCPVGTGHLREKATYHAYNFFGVNKVPPTVVRSVNGQPMSVQQWSETRQSIADKIVKGSLGDTSEFPKYDSGAPVIKNETKFLIDSCPAEKREKLVQDLQEGVAMAVLVNHNDQHFGNVMLGDDYSLNYIDNTTCLGNGLFGNKVQMHEEMHSLGMKVKVPDHLMERYKNTTLDEMQRDLGQHSEDWAVGQTFMRMKYMMYLMETEGHLDYEKFRPSIRSGADDETLKKQLKNAETSGDPRYIKHYKMCLGAPREGFWKGSEREIQDEYDNRKANGLLSHQLFDSFAKQWIEDSKKLPDNHPDRIAADKLDKIGIFMDSSEGFTMNIQEYRSSGKHKEYEKRIKAGYPPQKIKGSDGVVEVTTTKKTAPSARKKPSGDKQVFKKPVEDKVATPEALARTHLKLEGIDPPEETNKKDLDAAVPQILPDFGDSDIDDAFGDITSNPGEQKDDDVIDLTDEVEMLNMFSTSDRKTFRKARIYIAI